MGCTERGAAYLVLVVVVGADDVAERELLPGVVRGAGDGIPRRDGQLAWRSINTAHPHWHADRPRNRIAFPSIERRRVCCAFASIERRRGCCCLLTVTFLVAHQLRSCLPQDDRSSRLAVVELDFVARLCELAKPPVNAVEPCCELALLASRVLDFSAQLVTSSLQLSSRVRPCRESNRSRSYADHAG